MDALVVLVVALGMITGSFVAGAIWGRIAERKAIALEIRLQSEISGRLSDCLGVIRSYVWQLEKYL